MARLLVRNWPVVVQTSAALGLCGGWDEPRAATAGPGPGSTSGQERACSLESAWDVHRGVDGQHRSVTARARCVLFPNGEASDAYRIAVTVLTGQERQVTKPRGLWSS